MLFIGDRLAGFRDDPPVNPYRREIRTAGLTQIANIRYEVTGEDTPYVTKHNERREGLAGPFSRVEAIAGGAAVQATAEINI